MSGCQPDNTNSCRCLCHTYSQYRQCDICDCYVCKPIKIESGNSTNYEERIRKLEDAFDKIFSSIDHSIKHNQDGIEKCFDKIEELEKTQIFQLDKIGELSFKINRIASDCKVAFDNSKDKVHKCPVCDGKPLHDLKIVKTDSGRDKLLFECHACQGKGIIWK